MHLVRDLLDKEVVDRHGRAMGRVDRIIIASGGGSLAVTAIEVGASALGVRLSPGLGRCVAGLLQAFGVDEGQPLRIHVSRILDIAEKVKVDLAFGETAAANVERKLRHWIGAFPRAGK